MKNGNQQVTDNRRKFDRVKSPAPNLIRYKPSNNYFARVRLKGKLFCQTFKTELVSVPKLHLAVTMQLKIESDSPSAMQMMVYLYMRQKTRYMCYMVDGQRLSLLQMTLQTRYRGVTFIAKDVNLRPSLLPDPVRQTVADI